MSRRIVRDAVGVSKFKGSLVGALLGDCLGAPFEGEEEPSTDTVQQYFDNLEDPSFRSPLKMFTDDTAMTRGILESFVEQCSFDKKDIANRFVVNYFREPHRGYGESVVTVFRKLQRVFWKEDHKPSESSTNLYRPAQEQFNGSGSLGNGGAMRIAPVALFCYANYNLMLSTAQQCTKLTHTHKLGINGALLQAIAVRQGLLEDPNQPLDVEKFISDVIKEMKEIEKVDLDESNPGDEMPYVKQLELVKSFLMAGSVDDDNVIETLGTSIQALYSVPTALYCFLRAQTPIDSIQTENKFRRAIQYCITLGGDTDTIASMAAAISGAYHGFEYIDVNIQSHCEGIQETIELAERLHSITSVPLLSPDSE